MRKIMIWGLIVLGGYLFLCLVVYWGQEKLVFPGNVLAPDYPFSFTHDLSYEEVWLDNSDARLHGLFFKADSPKGVVLYFHGNGGCLADWGEVAANFVPWGYSVLMMDYRGYGKSQGPRSQAKLLADAEQAYDFVAKQFAPESIILYGRSLGSGIASYLAGRHPAKALMLETPYCSIARRASEMFPWLPVRQLLRYPFPQEKWLDQVAIPIYLIHGTEDRVIPHQHCRDLYQRLGPEAAQYWEVEGGTHHNLSEYPAYRQFLEACL